MNRPSIVTGSGRLCSSWPVCSAETERELEAPRLPGPSSSHHLVDPHGRDHGLIAAISSRQTRSIAGASRSANSAATSSIGLFEQAQDLVARSRASAAAALPVLQRAEQFRLDRWKRLPRVSGSMCCSGRGLVDRRQPVDRRQQEPVRDRRRSAEAPRRSTGARSAAASRGTDAPRRSRARCRRTNVQIAARAIPLRRQRSAQVRIQLDDVLGAPSGGHRVDHQRAENGEIVLEVVDRHRRPRAAPATRAARLTFPPRRCASRT